MNTRTRPLGITALAFASIVAGLYSMIAAIALLLGGLVGGTFGADSAVVMALGALYLGLMAAAFFLGFAFWTQRHWAWAGGLVLFGAFIVASVAMAVIATSAASAIVTAIFAGVAIWYLFRPSTKALLLGANPTQEVAPPSSAALETPQVAP
jgi:hypothetical protein